jgi:L-alanine-DL-glutamate epimerase-like enolase superfamily enzyme
MAKIVHIEAFLVDLKPKVKRVDAIQSFVSQETPIVRITDADGAVGAGYAYTIGTGGASVMALIERTFAPALLGREADEVERIWRDLMFLTHATTVGAITALAQAAIDTALWDLRCHRAALPLHRMAGGARSSVPLYTTEGGWLHLEPAALVDDALRARAAGFGGAKIKIGRPHVADDVARLAAVRDAVGPGFEIMTDANQAFTVDEAIRRARHYEALDIAWFEEPLPADDLGGHVRLSNATSVPVAVGESLYSLLHFREYLAAGACSVVQVDVARIGGITPWLKVAHLAESFNLPVCPHFLMELHVALCCAVPNARWVEYIPQLDTITTETMRIDAGRAVPSPEPGLGIAWDWAAIARLAEANLRVSLLLRGRP